MERPAVQYRSGRAPDPDRVQRLDQPALGRRPSGEEHICSAVEQDHDRDMGDPAAGLLEMKVETDRQATHVADLQVGDHEVGGVLLDGKSHFLAGVELSDVGLVVFEGRSQLLED